MAQSQTANVPPQNLDAERSVLGAMMVSESAVSPVIDEVKLKAEDFYLDRHRAIFACLYDLYGKSSPTDELSVIESLKGRGELEKAGDRVSMLLTDVNLAGKIDGVELAHFAHDCYPEIRVVVTSGSPLTRSLPDGATFMSKPLLPLDVLREAERSRH